MRAREGPAREGRVRLYVAGLRILTVPGHARPDARAQPLPWILVRQPVRAGRSGAIVLRQALALLTGERAALPSPRSADGMLACARHHLPGGSVELLEAPDPAGLLQRCLDTVLAGGLALLRWQALPGSREIATGSPPPSSPAGAEHWLLLAGVEGVWQAPGSPHPVAPCALLVLDPTRPPTWGCGHNLHLAPCEGGPEASRYQTGLPQGWTARTQDGGHAHGAVAAALLLTPPHR